MCLQLENKLGPVVRIKDDKIELNKEPEKSKILEEKRKNANKGKNGRGSPKSTSKGRPKTTENNGDRIRPLTGTEVMSNDPNFNRPLTRAGDGKGRTPKKFIIKKKKHRLQSGFRNPKKWNERFYLTNSKGFVDDPIGRMYSRSKSSRLLSGKTRKDYYSKIDQEMKGIQNFKATKGKHSLMKHKWDDRFYITSSKNNLKVHNDYKEFFDRPIEYDVRGYNYTIRPGPMMVYEDEQGRPDIRHPTFDGKKKKEIAKRVSREKSKTSRGETRLATATTKNWNGGKIDEYGPSNNHVFGEILRNPKKKKVHKTMKKKENKWNQRFAVPISTYNEAVFKKYRLSFEEI